MSENNCTGSTQENSSIASFSSPKESQNGMKRIVDCTSEDDGASLSKYKRLMTDEEILESNKRIIRAPILPTEIDNDTTSESSNTEHAYYDKENIPDNSSIISYDDRRIDNNQNDDFQFCKAGASSNDYLLTPKEKVYAPMIQTSQFSTDNMNNNGSLNEIIVKRSNSQSYEVETQRSEEEMMEAESLNLSTNKTVQQDDGQDVNIQNIISANQYAGISQSHDGSKSLVIEKNHYNPIDPQYLPAIMNSGQAYVEQNNLIRPVETNMQLHPIPSTSANVTEASNGTNLENINVPQLILDLRNDIKTLTHKFEDQENILSAVVAANQIYLEPLLAASFAQRYNLRLPLSRLEDFENFNQTLVSNTRFANEFIMDLCKCIDNNTTLSKNILEMLRKYMSKELARLFTATQKTGNKRVLKDTMFCTCLLQALKISIRNGMLPKELEKSFFRNLSLVVTGAKGWHIRDDISED